MIEVGINGRSLEKPRATGVARYTCSLLAAIAEMREGGKFSITAFGTEASEAIPEGIAVSGRAPRHSGLRAHAWEQLALPRRIRSADLDVFHTPGGHPPILSGTPLVTTIHDISPITHPEWFSHSYATLYRVMTPLAVRRSDRIITVSEFARDEIIDRYPSAKGKTVAIYNGVSDRSVGAATRPSSIDSEGYLLFVGASNPRKNLRRLLKAYDQYRQSSESPRKLVLVGPGRNVYSELELPSVKGVQNIGFVEEPELTWLYRNASLFVFPSLYEGFGLPILEAMSAGTPVLTSNVGAMAEVASEAGYLVDPTSVPEITDGIQVLLNNEEDRDALIRSGERRAAKFTWKRTAQQTVDVYQKVINENKRP